MQDNSARDLQILLHPYLFVLKEGKDIKDNLLDYSLHMLRINATEVINSPGTTIANPTYVPHNFHTSAAKNESNSNIMEF